MRYLLLFVPALVIMIGFQNCSQQMGLSVLAPRASLSSVSLPSAAVPVVPSPSLKSQTFPVSVTTSTPDLDVLIVVDDSASMIASQARLSRGIAPLLEKLKGFNAKYVVGTTSPLDPMVVQPGVRGPDTAVADFPGAPKGATGIWYQGFGSSAGAWSLNNAGDGFNQPSLGFATGSLFTADLIPGFITDLGAGGVPQNQGLCNVMRYLTNRKLSGSKSKLLTILISDSDDQSTLGDDCYGLQGTYFEDLTDTVTYAYSYSDYFESVDYRVSGLSDKTPLIKSYNFVFTAPNPAVARDGGSCFSDATLQDLIHNDLAGQDVRLFDAGTMKITLDSCTYRLRTGRLSQDHGTNTCAGLYQSSTVVAGSCVAIKPITYTAPHQLSQMGSFRSMLSPSRLAGVDNATLVKTELENVYGFGNYYVSMITNPADSSCKPDASIGQVNGKMFSELATLAGVNGSVTPICSPDYSPALAKISDQIVSTFSTTFDMSQDKVGQIVSVEIVQNNQTVATLNSSQYLFDGKILTVEAPLKLGEQIVVRYQ